MYNLSENKNIKKKKKEEINRRGYEYGILFS